MLARHRSDAVPAGFGAGDSAVPVGVVQLKPPLPPRRGRGRTELSLASRPSVCVCGGRFATAAGGDGGASRLLVRAAPAAAGLEQASGTALPAISFRMGKGSGVWGEGLGAVGGGVDSWRQRGGVRRCRAGRGVWRGGRRGGRGPCPRGR